MPLTIILDSSPLSTVTKRRGVPEADERRECVAYVIPAAACGFGPGRRRELSVGGGFPVLAAPGVPAPAAGPCFPGPSLLDVPSNQCYI
jgi:hypothetical protein